MAGGPGGNRQRTAISTRLLAASHGADLTPAPNGTPDPGAGFAGRLEAWLRGEKLLRPALPPLLIVRFSGGLRDCEPGRHPRLSATAAPRQPGTSAYTMCSLGSIRSGTRTVAAWLVPISVCGCPRLQEGTQSHPPRRAAYDIYVAGSRSTEAAIGWEPGHQRWRPFEHPFPFVQAGVPFDTKFSINWNKDRALADETGVEVTSHLTRNRQGGAANGYLD